MAEATGNDNDFFDTPSLIQSQSDLERALGKIVEDEMGKFNAAIKEFNMQTFSKNHIAAQRDKAVNDTLQKMNLPHSKNAANADEIPKPEHPIAQKLNDGIQTSLQQTIDSSIDSFINRIPLEARQKLEQQRIGNELFNDPTKIATKEETQFVISAIRQSVKDDLTNGGTISTTPELEPEIKRVQKKAVEDFYKHAPQAVKDFLKDIQSDKKHVTQPEVQNEHNDGLYVFVDHPERVKTPEDLHSALNAVKHFVKTYRENTSINSSNAPMTEEVRQKNDNTVLTSTVHGFLNTLPPETQQNLKTEIQQIKDTYAPKPKEQPALAVIAGNKDDQNIHEQQHKQKTGLEGIRMLSVTSFNGASVQGAEVASGGQVKGA